MAWHFTTCGLEVCGFTKTNVYSLATCQKLTLHLVLHIYKSNLLKKIVSKHAKIPQVNNVPFKKPTYAKIMSNWHHMSLWSISKNIPPPCSRRFLFFHVTWHHSHCVTCCDFFFFHNHIHHFMSQHEVTWWHVSP
jgi:hypothetical protein